MLHSPAGPMVTVEPSKTLTLLWGATGEQEWTPALTTGKKPFKELISQFIRLIEIENNSIYEIGEKIEIEIKTNFFSAECLNSFTSITLNELDLNNDETIVKKIF